MDEILLNQNNEQLFILDEYIDQINEEENSSNEYQSPLCVAEIYETEFLNNFHLNYYGELEDEGPFLLSIRHIHQENDQLNISSSSVENSNDDHQTSIRALIRTPHENWNISFQSSNLIEEKNLLEILFEHVHLSNMKSFYGVHHLKANETIYEFDKENDPKQFYKIGVITQYADQINENQLFSNNQISLQMEHFLHLIGERVQLQGFKEYRADLDTKCNEHGEYSYFTKSSNYQIMFNIAPLIPSDKNDGEFVQRKSLVLNSFVCIVFQEENAKFQGNLFSGKVIQAFITVQPTTINNQLYYKIRIWHRSHIRTIPNHAGGIYKIDQSFGEKFLKLIINVMNIILEKGTLHEKIIEQKQRLKYENFLKLFCKFDLNSSYLNISNDENEMNQRINMHLRKKKTKSENNSKRRHTSLLPKLSEALNKVKPLWNISSSGTSLPNLIDNQSPTNNHSNVLFQQSHSKSVTDDSNESFDENKFTCSPLFPTLSLVTNTLHSMRLTTQQSQSSNTNINEQNLSNHNKDDSS